MRDLDAIESYLGELGSALRRAGRPTEPLVDEARAHLYEDAARIAAAERCSHDEAARRAVARFGVVADVLHAVRRNAPIAAAQVARAATVLLMAWLAWEVIDAFRRGDLWPPSGQDMWLSFVAELILVSWGLWRGLGGGRVPAWLRPALALQGALGFAIFVTESTLTMRFIPSWTSQVSIFGAFVHLVVPLWLLMAVQGAAGLRALRQQATQVGQPSLPVELQPPG